MKSILILVFAVLFMGYSCTVKDSAPDMNKIVVENMINALNQNDWADNMGAFMSPADFESYKEIHTRFREAFPDYHYAIEVIATAGDTVVVVGNVSVTHRAPLDDWFFKGVEPTGRQFKWKEIWVLAVSDGKITGVYSLIDNLDILHQLGIDCPPQAIKEGE